MSVEGSARLHDRVRIAALLLLASLLVTYVITEIGGKRSEKFTCTQGTLQQLRRAGKETSSLRETCSCNNRAALTAVMNQTICQKQIFGRQCQKEYVKPTPTPTKRVMGYTIYTIQSRQEISSLPTAATAVENENVIT